jgi:hypothetical protein
MGEKIYLYLLLFEFTLEKGLENYVKKILVFAAFCIFTLEKGTGKLREKNILKMCHLYVLSKALDKQSFSGQTIRNIALYWMSVSPLIIYSDQISYRKYLW